MSMAVPALARSADPADKVRTEIRKLGAGLDTRVKVKLKDGTKVEGFIAEVNDTEFVVENTKTGVRTPVPYTAAKQVRGNNLSGTAKILIGVGAALAFIFLVVPKLMDED